MNERWCGCKGHNSQDFTKLTDHYCHCFIPEGWQLEYTTVIEPEDTRTLYITGKCSQCGGFMRSGVSIYGKYTHDNLLEDICRAMLTYRPYAGKDKSGIYQGGVPRRQEWYWHQDQLARTQRIEQFVLLFRESELLIARQWAEEHMPVPGIRRETSTEFFNAVVNEVQINGFWPGQSAFITCEPACNVWPPDAVLCNHQFDFHPILEISPEGVRIDCCLRGRFDKSGRKYLSIGTIKTACTNRDTCLTMGALTGALLHYGEAWRNNHLERYLPHPGKDGGR